jgi:hypothetical protein
MNELTNPYSVEHQQFTGDEKNLFRAVAYIGATDFLFIKGIRPLNGTVTITQNLLWHKLCDSLRKAGIVDLSQQRDFEDFLMNMKVVDGRKKGTKK